ncbi:MAG: MaoC family dehydratase [Gammaproteobacteria bacterium]|nr:MaoC family dehydratase [Gammaproteobacteria bacterium]
MGDSKSGRAADRARQLHGYYFEDLALGMRATFSKTFTEADVQAFTAISGDTNPLHLDPEFAAATRAGEPILHGLLTASLFSTLVGTRLPGPGGLYMSQELKFLAPVQVGSTVCAEATVIELNADKQRVRLKTVCTVEGEMVVVGEAWVWVPARGGVGDDL